MSDFTLVLLRVNGFTLGKAAPGRFDLAQGSNAAASRQWTAVFSQERFMCRWSPAALALVFLNLGAAASAQDPPEVAARYRSQVERRLDVPQAEVQRYASLAEAAFAKAGVQLERAQYVAVVDRSPYVQALLLLWRSAQGDWSGIGAAPVSTGRPGSFDHFETPLGVFEHSTANPDFRAEGTLNENGIRGYGAKGLRIFDFGWQQVPKGWGDGKVIEMRLQMHATDADALEQRLGTVQSKGCVRIPAAVNRFIDHYGLLDADYERAARAGQNLWVLRDDREPVAGAGRYLVVVESTRDDRPDWSPSPFLPHRRPAAPPHKAPTASLASRSAKACTCV
jgi:hypothetical protein